jgi:hypothetical protein
MVQLPKSERLWKAVKHMSAKWARWVYDVTEGVSMTKISRRIGVARSNVSHWMNDGVPAHAVVQIAVAYHADLIAGLVAADWLKPEQVADLDPTEMLRHASTDALVDELERRGPQHFELRRAN